VDETSPTSLIRFRNRHPFLPDLAYRVGQAAVFAAEEFFYCAIRNEHTGTAYRRDANRILAWCEQRGFENT
jgi:hypothetical protein